MFKLSALFRKKTLWDFHGGIHPPEMKSQTSAIPLRYPPLARQFVLPLKQHLGEAGELCVKPGDHVLRGQALTHGQRRMLPIHAPTSGHILAITPHISAHPSALSTLSIIIRADGEDRWITRQPWQNYRQHSRSALIERIHQFGIAGLGGAGFPAAVKLQDGGEHIRTLIINAAECEPYITADDRLMQEQATEIITGIQILGYILQPQRILIGIEDNKPQAIARLRAALPAISEIELRIIPAKYPSGGARQLTQILTGKQVPRGGRSSDIGVLMHNTGTVYAIKRAIINGEPLTERVVTLTGQALQHPGNVWARMGTPVRHLLEYAGFQPGENQLVIMGGPLMGFTLPQLDVPIVKISNCLLAPSDNEMAPATEEKACIRCSACAQACPVELLPQQLYWYSKGQQHDKASAYHLDACIECGACAWVCPSHIPLVHYFRQEKAQIQAISQQTRRAADAKARFAARNARLEREKNARIQRHKQAAVQPDEALSFAHPKATADSNSAKLILAGSSQLANSNTESQPETAKITDHVHQSAVAAALARVRGRKAQQEQQTPAAETAAPHNTASEETTPGDNTAHDPRKAAVAAALARVRARKAQQEQQTPAAETVAPHNTASEETTPGDNTALDPRKAAVAAALARVRARKAQQEQQTPAAKTAAPHNTASEEITPSDNTAHDPRKAAVAAALARVRARKAQQEQQTPAAETAAPHNTASEETTPGDNTAHDPRKAAVAAALARVRARKAQQEQQTPAAETGILHTTASETTNSSDNIISDPHNTTVTSAIARVTSH